MGKKLEKRKRKVFRLRRSDIKGIYECQTELMVRGDNGDAHFIGEGTIWFTRWSDFWVDGFRLYRLENEETVDIEQYLLDLCFEKIQDGTWWE